MEEDDNTLLSNLPHYHWDGHEWTGPTPGPIPAHRIHDEVIAALETEFMLGLHTPPPERYRWADQGLERVVTAPPEFPYRPNPEYFRPAGPFSAPFQDDADADFDWAVSAAPRRRQNYDPGIYSPADMRQRAFISDGAHWDAGVVEWRKHNGDHVICNYVGPNPLHPDDEDLGPVRAFVRRLSGYPNAQGYGTHPGWWTCTEGLNQSNTPTALP